MSLQSTIKHMNELLANITSDLAKSDGGNKAASQRVRTGTVKLEKLAKTYRKESISSEKGTKGKKKPAKAAAKAHKAPAHKAAAHKAPAHKAAAHKAKPKAKVAKTSVRSSHLTVKRATAKLPTRRFGFSR